MDAYTRDELIATVIDDLSEAEKYAYLFRYLDNVPSDRLARRLGYANVKQFSPMTDQEDKGDEQ